MKFWLLLFTSTLLATPCTYLPSMRQGHFLSTSNFYGALDFLWWEGTEKGLEFASKNTQSTFNQEIQIYEPAFRFEPAFRLSLGYHLPHDNWDLEFAYTRFYTHTTDHAHSSGSIRSIWTSSVAFQDTTFRALWQNAASEWKLHSNFFELFLKHPFCLSTEVTIEPALSLKCALLQQSYQVDYTNGNTASSASGTSLQFLNSSISMKNRSFNLGPAASLLSRWYFADHFNLFANLSGALFASHFHVARDESDAFLSPSPQFDTLQENSTYWTLRPQASAALGLSWSDSICRPKRVLYYAFSASYETQIYWKQNMLYRFIDNTSGAMLSPTQGTLFFHGLTLTTMLDF